jgi:hypothetical protein
MKRETLIKNLQKNVMQITFNKVSGEERVMHCTLNETFVPETSANNKKNNDEVLPVWDVDIGAWRSFRLDTITNVAKLEVI